MERSNTLVRKAKQVESLQLCLCMAVVGTEQSTDSQADICRYQVAFVFHSLSIVATWPPDHSTDLQKTSEWMRLLLDQPPCSPVDDYFYKPGPRHHGRALPCSMLFVFHSRWQSAYIETVRTCDQCCLAGYNVSHGSHCIRSVLTLFRSFSRVAVSQQRQLSRYSRQNRSPSDAEWHEPASIIAIKTIAGVFTVDNVGMCMAGKRGCTHRM